MSDDSGRRLRILLVATHPVQYSAHIFRLLAKDPRIEMQVAYCSLQGAEAGVDEEFGIPVQWDIPLLDGYPWTLLPNRFGKSKLGSFFGLFNSGIWRLISKGNFDAVVFYTGYRYSTFWMGIAAAKWNRVPVFFGTDANGLAPRDVKAWKTRLKKWLWPHLFGLADTVIVPSTGGINLMRSLGIPDNKIALTPYCVDNQWWIQRSREVDQAGVRTRWNVPHDAVVMLFCAKLQDWKRPQELLHAFIMLGESRSYLVFAGDGALRSTLEAEAKSAGVGDRVRFLGFVNQSGLPEVYTASDIMVLPSSYEPFGVVVNEAMLCGCAVVVSDRVGARLDLVSDGKTGFVFPVRDVTTLAAILRGLLEDPERLANIRRNAFERIRSWAPEMNRDALIESVERVRRETPPELARES